jgi:uncharacterized protein (UPF0261 family)
VAGSAAPAPAAQRPVILLPAGGLSAIDVDGLPFHDAAADAALAAAIRASPAAGQATIVEVPGNLDRAETGQLAARLLHDLITARGGVPCTP